MMTKTEQMVVEFERRKRNLEKNGYEINQYAYDNLLIVEMLVKDEHTSETLVRKQEGVVFRGRTDFAVECRKVMALERLSNVVPQMWLARKTRINRECRRKE